MNILAGKKTYIVAFGIVSSAVVGFLTGATDLGTAINTALSGLGLAALRIGVASNGTGQ